MNLLGRAPFNFRMAVLCRAVASFSTESPVVPQFEIAPAEAGLNLPEGEQSLAVGRSASADPRKTPPRNAPRRGARNRTMGSGIPSGCVGRREAFRGSALALRPAAMFHDPSRVKSETRGFFRQPLNLFGDEFQIEALPNLPMAESFTFLSRMTAAFQAFAPF